MGALGYSAPHSRHFNAVTVTGRSDEGEGTGAVVIAMVLYFTRCTWLGAGGGRVGGRIEPSDGRRRSADPARAVRLVVDGSERHGRRIRLDDPPGKSSTFATENPLRLGPLQRPDDARNRAQDPRLGARGAHAGG